MGAIKLVSSGSSTADSPVYFKTYNSASQSLSNATWTKVNFDTVQLDTRGWFDTVNMRFNPKRAGKYLIVTNFRLYGVGVTCQVWALGLNGGIVNNLNVTDGSGLAAYDARQISLMWDFNGDTDYVEAWCYVNAASGQGVEASGYFMGYYLGA